MNEKQQLWYLINGLLNSDYTIETFVRKTYCIVHNRTDGEEIEQYTKDAMNFHNKIKKRV